MPGRHIVIDLAGVKDSAAVLERLGHELCLGGPEGNHKVEAINAGSGWGMNWDALKDSLCCLDTGGIWGNSPIFEFPLKLEVRNSAAFSGHDPQGFRFLGEVLCEVSGVYRSHGLDFQGILRKD